MMPLPRLEVFETGPAEKRGPAMVTTELSVIEDAKLAAYEQGYQAGWDDAAAAQSEDRARIGADLARSLQALAFTYQEARAHVLGGLEPLMAEMIGRLLPGAARETLAPLVLERLMPMAEEMTDQPVHLVVNPASRPAVEALVAGATGLPMKIIEEATLAEGQAYLRLGTAEAKVDLTRATAEIAAAVRAFFSQTQETPSHG